jgi:2-(1,2-epoxy-1,2-dihydrophenyl)acetyl-CoA isomerase
MKDANVVRLTSHAKHLVISINRPERRNALDRQAWEELAQAVERAAEPGVRAVILTGEAGTFCAGGDMKSALEQTAGDGVFASASRLTLGQAVLRALYKLPKPTIAAVEGAAVGVGWSLALACDLIVAADDAFFLAPFVDRGLVPDGGIGWMLRRAAGPHVASQLLLLRERLSAERACSMGLVNFVTPSGGALNKATELALDLAEAPAQTVELIKGLVRTSDDTSFDEYLDFERTTSALNHYTGNSKRGISAFVAKRTPDFAQSDST